MAKLNPSRAAQTVLSAEFTFEFADTMKDVNGATKDFKTVGSTVVDAINLPPRATIISGEVVTETAVTGSTAYNVSVGDSGSATRYLGVTNRLSAGRTPLVPTGYVGDGENLRLTVAPTVADATAGKVTVRVQYIMRDRWSETVTN